MKVLVTGSAGMLGRAIGAQSSNYAHSFSFASKNEADLERAGEADRLVRAIRPDAVIHCAAVVGGIKLNMDSPEEMRDRNRAINQNLFAAARAHGVKKVVSFLSTCVFPENAPEPWDESMIHSGEADRRQWGYAQAKRELDLLSRKYSTEEGAKTRFVTLVPSTMYGPHDNFSPEGGHVLPAVLLKIHRAKTEGGIPVFWGSGSPRREFLYVDDMARVAIESVEQYDGIEPLIVSPGTDVSVKELVEFISKANGYNGPVQWDSSKTDGRLTRRTSNSKFLSIFSGFKFTGFAAGIEKTMSFFKKNYPALRGLPQPVGQGNKYG